jgi:hypothetical protein
MNEHLDQGMNLTNTCLVRVHTLMFSETFLGLWTLEMLGGGADLLRLPFKLVIYPSSPLDI